MAATPILETHLEPLLLVLDWEVFEVQVVLFFLISLVP